MTARTHCSLLSFPEIRDRLIVLNGWSKTWAMTGWRMGWSIWPNGDESGHLYDKVRKLAVNCWSCVNAPSQFAGIAAIDGPQDDVDKMMRAFDNRSEGRRRGAERSARHLLHHAEGRVLCLPQRFQETGWKAKKLASALLEDAGVALIGGPDFGILGEGYIRLPTPIRRRTSCARWSGSRSSWLSSPAALPLVGRAKPPPLQVRGSDSLTSATVASI